MLPCWLDAILRSTKDGVLSHSRPLALVHWPRYQGQSILFANVHISPLGIVYRLYLTYLSSMHQHNNYSQKYVRTFRLDVTIAFGPKNSQVYALGPGGTQADQGSEANIVSRGLVETLGIPMVELSQPGYTNLHIVTADQKFDGALHPHQIHIRPACVEFPGHLQRHLSLTFNFKFTYVTGASPPESGQTQFFLRSFKAP